jgi:hypothetical protein
MERRAGGEYRAESRISIWGRYQKRIIEQTAEAGYRAVRRRRI